MNLLSIEEPSQPLAISCHEHPSFTKEVEKLEKKIPTIREALKSLELLLQKQFHPTSPMTVITPKNLHRITANNVYEIWKVNCLATKGLSKSQMPRIYFVKMGIRVYYLCLGTHIDNYDDAELRPIAISRAQEILGV